MAAGHGEDKAARVVAAAREVKKAQVSIIKGVTATATRRALVGVRCRMVGVSRV